MRSFVVTLLTGLLLACPSVCGADEIGHGVQHETCSAECGKDQAPDQCPDDDNCVCRGAVQVGDVRPEAPGTVGAEPFLLALPPLQFAHLPHRHLTANGSPTGLASWGGSLTIRALLQNFRC